MNTQFVALAHVFWPQRVHAGTIRLKDEDRSIGGGHAYFRAVKAGKKNAVRMAQC
jgi:hypothetical protein